MTLKSDAILKEKLLGGLKNDIRNLVNFHVSSCKSENLHFDGLVLSKTYKVLDKKCRRVMSHYTYVSCLITHMSHVISLQNISLYIYVLSPSLHHVCEKIFKFMEFMFPENALFEEFLLVPLLTQNSSPSSCHHALGRRELLILPGSILSKICFPQQQKGVERTMICFIKTQSENMKMTWNIRFFMFCMICNFFKCNGFTVL